MTLRSIVLGLLGVIFICGFFYFNDFVIKQESLVPHLMPPVIYGVLILFILFLNPLLKWLKVGRTLTAGELAVITGLSLLACSVPGWGLVQCLPPTVVMPHHHVRGSPSYNEAELLRLAPEGSLVDVSEDEDRVINGYVGGLGRGDEHIGFADVPWHAWWRTLLFWVPVILSIMIATLALAVVVHRQWAHHEQLPYPISTFAHSLLPGEGETQGSVFRSRLFWAAALIIGGIHVNNYLCRWWPGELIKINLQLDLTPLAKLFPFLGGWLLHPLLMFSVVGIAYFLPSAVSLSVGIVSSLYLCVVWILAGYGVSLAGGDHLGVNFNAFLFSGGYFGILLMLIYTGRHFYWNVLKRSVLLLGASGVDSGTVWAMRVFITGTALFIFQMVLAGLDWQLAVLFTVFALMTYVVVSRIVAETGAFFIGTYFIPSGLLLGFLGATAVGPKAMMTMALFGGVLLLAPAWAPMPFAVQALRLMDLSKVKVSKGGAWLVAALVLGIAVALPLTLYWQYDQGVPKDDWPTYASIIPPRDAFKTQERLRGQGALKLSNSLHGWERFRPSILAPSYKHVTAFAITASLAVLVGLCHLRFHWWPLHPVMFVFLGSGHGQMMALSLLLGWLIKTSVAKYGGARLYHKIKPLMVGLIAGEVVAQFIPMVIGTIYYVATGETPK